MRIVLPSFSLLLCALMPVVSGCGDARTVLAATADPQEAITAMLQTEEAAWNVNDNVAYGSTYTDDADFVNIRGQIFTGKAAITVLHGQIFAGPFQGSTIKITQRLLKMLAPGVALVDTDQEVVNYKFLPPGIEPTSKGTLLTHFKYVAVLQKAGEWKFVSGQNTAALPH